MAAKRRLIDIGANLTDPVFRGIYHGTSFHPNDFEQVLERATRFGVEKIIVTGGSLQESRAALEISRTCDFLFSTVGVHPTRCKEFLHDEEIHILQLQELLRDNQDGKIVAVGEFGLDYDRTQFCPVNVQKRYFEKQFILAEQTSLPLFLHSRNAHDDFIDIVTRNRRRFSTGVVHSFTGTIEEAKKILDLDLFIGFNGCSLKTAENLKVVEFVPVSRMMIETDAPWCDIRHSHVIHT